MAARGHRRWAWWGILFAPLFIASIVAGNALLATKSLYLPQASAAELRAFYTGNRTAILVQSALQALAALALYRFGRGVTTTLRPVARRAATTRTMAAGTAAASGFLVLAIGCSLLLTASAASLGDAAITVLGKATLMFGGALHLIGLATLITAASITTLRSGTRGRWVGYYGQVIGPLMLLSVLSIVWAPLVKAEVPWRLLASVWIIGVAIVALRGRLDTRGAVPYVPARNLP